MPEITALLIGVCGTYFDELQQTLSRCTERHYALSQVSTFEEALHVIQAKKPDVILVASCAGIQGYQNFIKEVHSQDCLQPVIILETEPGDTDEFNYLQYGADFYLKSWRNEPVLFEQAVMTGIERG